MINDLMWLSNNEMEKKTFQRSVCCTGALQEKPEFEPVVEKS